MKSKDAEKYLFEETTDEKEFQSMTDLIPIHDAVKAVEIAESELYTEEQVVEVFKITCEHYDDGRQMCWLHNLSCNMDCKTGVDFLSALKSTKK